MSHDFTLSYGTHATPAEGRCAMEWVSYLAGEPHSDDPACVSPVLRAYCTTLNDSLEDAPRQRLRPYLARTIGTTDDGLDDARSWMAMDWLIRTYAPTWLAVAGLTGSAAASGRAGTDHGRQRSPPGSRRARCRPARHSRGVVRGARRGAGRGLGALGRRPRRCPRGCMEFSRGGSVGRSPRRSR